jgi:hypothetical protein
MHDSSPPPDDAFGSLIDPIATDTFFERYFERDILHVVRKDAAYFTDLYSVASVEDALVLGATEPDHFALIEHDELTRENMTTDRNVVRFRAARKAPRPTIDPRSIIAAFAAGQTLNITDATAYHPTLAQLCNRIQAQLGIYTQANAYFTPPHAQGFGVHYDTHDTLILQIDGAKDWRVYDPVVPLPLEAQPFSAAKHAGRLGTARTLRLSAGDTLYIPHGFPHEALTTDQRSLHLTLALAPVRTVDLLDALVQLAALGDVELRRALPPGWQRDPDFAPKFAARLTERMADALSAQRIELAAELAHNEVFAASRTVARGAFDALAAFDALTPASLVCLRTDTPYELRDRGARLAIILASKVVNVPANARAAFARLAHGPASVAELDALLGDGSARDFVRTLVIEGLATIGNAPNAPVAERANVIREMFDHRRPNVGRTDRPALKRGA